MISIGVDIEDISRFKNKSEKFFKRIFTDSELKYCLSYKNPQSHLCARFCAKEAVIKSLSKFSNKIISFNEIEILNYKNGEPYVNILSEQFKDIEFSISISHEKEKAVAFVIAQKKE